MTCWACEVHTVGATAVAYRLGFELVIDPACATVMAGWVGTEFGVQLAVRAVVRAPQIAATCWVRSSR